MDAGDYNPAGRVFKRPSARGIIAKDGKVLLCYSKKYDYYKFPGGGIEKGEDPKNALIREVAEETGYVVETDSVTEYGSVLRRQRDSYDENSIFEQDNLYYFCEIREEKVERRLDDYEEEEGFTPVWMPPFEASHHNRYSNTPGCDAAMLKRESKVLDMVDLELRRRDRKAEEQKAIDKLGHPEYREMLAYVEEQLTRGAEFAGSAKNDINYSRFAHVKRVLGWTIRLYEGMEDKTGIRYEDLCIATIFHDVGRSACMTNGLSHAQAGVPLTEEYLTSHGYDKERIRYICELVAAHSDKHRMNEENIDINLLLLMEADLMDDMGALGLVMDCMIIENRNREAVFEDCYDHICRYTHRLQQDNPMVTPVARAYWEEKTKLVNEFTRLLGQDLCI